MYKSEDEIKKALFTVYEEAKKTLNEGKIADYIPELAKADRNDLGAAIWLKNGNVIEVGDSTKYFTIQSISKTISLILAIKSSGYKEVFSKVGMEPSGNSFNSLLKLEISNKHPFNPMINAGAIATVGLINSDDPFGNFLDLTKKLCGDENVYLNQDVYLSEKKSGTRNRAIAYLLKESGILEKDVEQTLDIYFRMCSVMVNAKGLAHYGMILSNDGIDPVTYEDFMGPKTVRTLKAIMMLCGMYDKSGEYAVKVGMPCKSGVGGGILCAAPYGIGIGTYSPSLDEKGNSVAGNYILRYLSKKLNLNYFSLMVND